MGVLAVAAGIAVGLFVLRKLRERNWGWCHCSDDLSGNVIVITGANSGIGYETARDLAHKGAVVVLACRDAVRAQAAVLAIKKEKPLGDVLFFELDLENNKSINQFVRRFLEKFQHINVLINNAGVFYPPQSPPLTNNEGIEIHFAVNHLGHFLLTHLLSDSLASTKNSRVVIVSSELYKNARLNLDDLNATAINEDPCKLPTTLLYSNSKLANLLYARELHRRLKGRGVTVCAASPGFTYTRLFRNSLHHYGWLKKVAFLPVAFLFMRSASQGAQTIIHCTCSMEVMVDSKQHSVPFFQNCKRVPLLPVAEDDLAARKLWDVSLSLLGLD